MSSSSGSGAGVRLPESTRETDARAAGTLDSMAIDALLPAAPRRFFCERGGDRKQDVRNACESIAYLSSRQRSRSSAVVSVAVAELTMRRQASRLDRCLLVAIRSAMLWPPTPLDLAVCDEKGKIFHFRNSWPQCPAWPLSRCRFLVSFWLRRAGGT